MHKFWKWNQEINDIHGSKQAWIGHTTHEEYNKSHQVQHNGAFIFYYKWLQCLPWRCPICWYFPQCGTTGVAIVWEYSKNVAYNWTKAIVQVHNTRAVSNLHISSIAKGSLAMNHWVGCGTPSADYHKWQQTHCHLWLVGASDVSRHGCNAIEWQCYWIAMLLNMFQSSGWRPKTTIWMLGWYTRQAVRTCLLVTKWAKSALVSTRLCTTALNTELTYATRWKYHRENNTTDVLPGPEIIMKAQDPLFRHLVVLTARHMAWWQDWYTPIYIIDCGQTSPRVGDF